MSSSPTTLGFYEFGVPVIFLCSKTIAWLHKGIWDYPIPDPEPEEISQLKRRATYLHELRHFHDAMLSPYLFPEFLLEIQRNHLGMLLLYRLARSGAKVASAAALDNESAELVRHHNAALARHHSFRDSFGSINTSGSQNLSFRLNDLMELNALVTELAFVEAEAGESTARSYWRYWEPRLTGKHKQLISETLRSASVSDAMGVLHQKILTCLIFGDLTEVPFDLGQPHGGLETAIEVRRIKGLVYETVTDCEFEIMELTIDTHTATDLVLGGAELARGFDTQFIASSDLRRARQELAWKAMETDFELGRYVRGLQGLPLPPTCFFADGDMIESNLLPFVRMEDLKRVYGQALMIEQRRDQTRRTTIASGIIPIPYSEPVVPLNKVGNMLACRYMSQDIFGEKVTYCPGMDAAFGSWLTDLIGLVRGFK